MIENIQEYASARLEYDRLIKQRQLKQSHRNSLILTKRLQQLAFEMTDYERQHIDSSTS
jgi:cytidylate kinase